MDTHIPTIIFRTACPQKHGDVGEPCFSVRPLDPANQSTAGTAVCDARARQAGYVGKITAPSLFRGRALKRHLSKSPRS